MKLRQSEVLQIIKGLRLLEKRYENAGRAVPAEDMKAVRSALPKFKELVK